MPPTSVAVILLVAQIGLLALTVWRAYLSNKDLFKTAARSQSAPDTDPFFSQFSWLYNLLDRIPLMRCSGTANEFDLLKGLLLSVFLIAILNLPDRELNAVVLLIWSNGLMLLVNLAMLIYPLLKR